MALEDPVLGCVTTCLRNSRPELQGLVRVTGRGQLGLFPVLPLSFLLHEQAGLLHWIRTSGLVQFRVKPLLQVAETAASVPTLQITSAARSDEANPSVPTINRPIIQQPSSRQQLEAQHLALSSSRNSSSAHYSIPPLPQARTSPGAVPPSS